MAMDWLAVFQVVKKRKEVRTSSGMKNAAARTGGIIVTGTSSSKILTIALFNSVDAVVCRSDACLNPGKNLGSVGGNRPDLTAVIARLVYGDGGTTKKDARKTIVTRLGAWKSEDEPRRATVARLGIWRAVSFLGLKKT
jgi:hypothetical protein